MQHWRSVGYYESECLAHCLVVKQWNRIISLCILPCFAKCSLTHSQDLIAVQVQLCTCFWNAENESSFGRRYMNVKVVEIQLDSKPIRYLFGTELDRTLNSKHRKRINIISYIAKKCILLSWNQQRPPKCLPLRTNYESKLDWNNGHAL